MVRCMEKLLKSKAITQGELNIRGALYPALHKLERRHLDVEIER
jgi:hypothetical protein